MDEIKKTESFQSIDLMMNFKVSQDEDKNRNQKQCISQKKKKREYDSLWNGKKGNDGVQQIESADWFVYHGRKNSQAYQIQHSYQKEI